MVPYGPGGGFDRAVRAFAPFFAEALKKGATAVANNLPGAGGRRGSATVYRAKPNGYTLGIFNLPGFALPSILGEKVDYDLKAMSWIGRLESQNYVLLVTTASGIKSIADLQKQDKITFVSTGYGSTVLAAMQITADATGLANKDPVYLTGYKGTSGLMVGLIRGDGNVGMAPTSSAAKYLKSGDLRALAVSGEKSSLVGVPTFAEAGYPSLSALNLQRAIGGPPNMDAKLLTRLRAAFGKVVKNPDFLAAAKKARMNVSPLDGDDTAAEVAKSFSFYERYRTNLKNPNS